MKIKNIIYISILICGLTSCSKWIDITPTDRLSEDMLFSDKNGFLKAINGVYTDMANPELYGRFMTASSVDALANYYVMPSSVNVYSDFSTFNYTGGNAKYGFDRAWKKAYELIANLNVIIEKSENAPLNVLPQTYRDLIKGEALGLRALLHFDMLRLFGPIWSENTKNTICIPYSTTTKTEISPLLSAEAVMKHILEDLNQAQELLTTVDPIRTEGVRHGANPAGPNDFYFRQYRLNYFAVKAMIARATLWKGDRVNTLKLAKEIIAEVQAPNKVIFPFVTSSAATNVNTPDRVFATEVIFSMYTINKEKLYNEVFGANVLGFNRLSFNTGNTDMSRVEALYDDKNDYRYRIWENINVEGNSLLTNQKYKNITDAPGRFMIPLIRLSELYLMVAEATDNLEEGKTYLNRIRTARNIISIQPADAASLNRAIMEEYRKEFIGEGQTFYYFKRKSLQTIPNHAALIGTKTMVLNNYTVPLPESETSLRNQNNTK